MAASSGDGACQLGFQGSEGTHKDLSLQALRLMQCWGRCVDMLRCWVSWVARNALHVCCQHRVWVAALAALWVASCAPTCRKQSVLQVVGTSLPYRQLR